MKNWGVALVAFFFLVSQAVPALAIGITTGSVFVDLNSVPVNAGDTITISGTLFSRDTSENGGGVNHDFIPEPMVVRVGGQRVFSQSDYNVPFGFSFVAPTTGLMTFVTQGFDGDQGPSLINYSLNPSPDAPRVQRDKLFKDIGLGSVFAGLTVTACVIITPCISVVATDLGVSIAVAKTTLGAAGLGASLLGFLTVLLARDPADFNFMVVAQPIPPAVPNLGLSGFPNANPALVATFTDLVKATADAIGLGRAIQTAFDRATGAFLKNAAGFQQLQLAAMGVFQQQFGEALARVGLDLRDLSNQLKTAGAGFVLTRGQISSFETSLLSVGFSPEQLAVLQAWGASQSEIQDILNLFIVQNPTLLAGDLFDRLDTTGLALLADGNDLASTPEPSTLLLFGASMLAAALAARKRLKLRTGWQQGQ
jgi:hypothetical protein